MESQLPLKVIKWWDKKSSGILYEWIAVCKKKNPPQGKVHTVSEILSESEHKRTKAPLVDALKRVGSFVT